MTAVAFVCVFALGVAVGIYLSPYIRRRSAFRRGIDIGERRGYRKGRETRTFELADDVRDTINGGDGGGL